MKGSENRPTQGQILYWEWKRGGYVSNLKLALNYAKVSSLEDAFWLEKELEKRYVGEHPHFSHY